MPDNSLDLECDRLSSVVDSTLFERLRWERNVGPVLARLVALAHAALEKRGEFEFAEEGATRDVKRFVLKVHGNRVMAIAMRWRADRRCRWRPRRSTSRGWRRRCNSCLPAFRPDLPGADGAFLTPS